ncbi:MAG: PLP-dependent aminotransferase family protein [Pseudorhodobacter sp.]
MSIWMPDPAAITRPAYRSLAQVIAGAVTSGELRPGDRLPTHRDLAFRLGLSVQTVSRAYEALIRADVIAGEVGRGTFVKGQRVEGRPPPYHRIDHDDRIIDCSMLTPVMGPGQAAAMDEVLAGMAGDLPAEVLYSFRPRQALRRHADRALGWLADCGVVARADQVLTTNGATPAMTVALATAALPGDTILTEELGHHTLKSLTRLHGMKLEGLACDVEGILPDALERAARKSGARVLFTLPGATNPRAQFMGADRRGAIVDVARRLDMTIVECDVMGPLDPDRPPPLAALAPERVFYVTTLSKVLLPGLRLGWLVVPEAHVTAAFTRHMVTNWMATPLMAEIASRLIGTGAAAKLVGWQRQMLLRRNRIAAECLDGLRWRGTGCGMHVWLDLPEGWEEAAFVNSARLRGVAIAPGNAFETGPGPRAGRGVRICLGAPDEDALREALTRIARLARNTPEPDFLTL